jgi:hypothetical protein
MDPADGRLVFRSGNAAGGISQLIYTPGQGRVGGDDWGLGMVSPYATLMRRLSFTVTDLRAKEILAVDLPVMAGAGTSGGTEATVIMIENSSPCPVSVIDRARLRDKGRLSVTYPRNVVEGLAALRHAMGSLPVELRSTLLDGAPLVSAYVIGLMDRAASVSRFGSGFTVTLPLPSLHLVTPLSPPGTGVPAFPEGILVVRARVTWTRLSASAIAAPRPSGARRAPLPAGSPAGPPLRGPARSVFRRRMH